MGVYTVVSRKKRSLFSSLNVNFSLILLNVFLFILFSVLIGLGVLSLDFVAIKPSNIFQGKYLWTFITSMFMHAGLFHIFANMLSLFFVGSFVEKLIGPKRYFYFYMFAGIFASLFFVLISFIFQGIEFNVFAVGASGAIFGLVGFLMILVPNLPVYIMFIPIPVKMKYAAPGILIVLWIISQAGGVPIGNTAHLGGFIFGIFYALYLRNKYKNKARAISRHFS